MARLPGIWVEYEPTTLQPDSGGTILRPFSAELATLRSATENGNRGIFVQFGETLAEAIAREAAAPAPKRAGAKPASGTEAEK